MAFPKPIGQKINEWTVLEQCKDNPQKYVCRCSCGKIEEKYLSNLRKGYSPNCGHDKTYKKIEKGSRIRNNLVGQLLGYWEVLEELGGGKVKVRCTACEVTEGTRYKHKLGKPPYMSCGCMATPYKTDLVGKVFGDWTVVKPAGNGYELCRCSCGNTGKVSRANLLNGNSTSCGCKQGQNMKNTMLERYGEIAPLRLDTPREKWQIETVENPDKFRAYINSLGYKPTIKDLCKLLGLNVTTMLIRVHKAGLDDLVEFRPARSEYEKEICNHINKLKQNIVIETRNRSILQGGKELDIYLPEYKLAIEFNGTYWHSTLFKDSNYHQQKTLECAKAGIRLIHIFEYEWRDENKKEKLKNYIASIILQPTKLYARDTQIREVSIEEEKAFLDKNHLQGYSPSSISLGLYNNEKLVSIMTFGKPRFSKEYDYEIIRYCNETNISVVGGAEKLFKHFLDITQTKSVITYSDISKFTGNVYTKLGFKVCKDTFTKPNYVWVEGNTNHVLSRYQTQKQKLLEKGFGTEDQTEEQIMTELGYLKVYDSGNIKLEYIK